MFSTCTCMFCGRVLRMDHFLTYCDRRCERLMRAYTQAMSAKTLSIPEIVDTSEKRDNAKGGVSCPNANVIPNNLKKKKPFRW